MSLKAVHICFILLSIALTFGLGYWGIQGYSISGKLMNLYLGLGSLVGGGLLTYYLFRFVQKMKKIPPLLCLGIFFASRYATACSVCFGDPHSRLSKGASAGVLFLIGLVVFVLGWIATLAFLWARKAQKIKEINAPS